MDLPHLASRIYGVPLLVGHGKLDAILAAIGPRIVNGEALAALERPPAGASRFTAGHTASGIPTTETGVAVIRVVGTLVRRSAHLDALSGLTSYASIEDQVMDAMTDPEVRAVLLEVDSHGGEAGGCFDLAESLRSIRDQAGKPLWTVANEAALSAAYAIACAADKLYVPRTGEVGSIGVVAVHVDQSMKDAKDGLAWTYIHAGARKVDGHPHAPLPEGVLAGLQADIDGLYGMFVDLVAKRRNLSTSAVRQTEAAVYRGLAAVDAGLADAVGTVSEALAALERVLGPAPAARVGALRHRAVATARTGHAALAGAPEVAALAPDIARAQERAVELLAICNRARRMGVRLPEPAELIRQGISPQALNIRLLELAAERDAAIGATSSISSLELEGPNATAQAGWDRAFRERQP